MLKLFDLWHVAKNWFGLGYIPLNMHKHSPRLFREEYQANIVTKMTSPVNHTCSIFCSINKDILMLVTNRHI